MCMSHEMKCACGARSASFHFRDNIMPEQVLQGLYCPSCASQVTPDPATMVTDNGWIIRYNMEIAQAMGSGRIAPEVTPGRLFDDGYCTWNGMYPGDNIDSVREREAITAMAKTDPIGYLKQLKAWATERAERLQQEGWRKARIAA